MASSEILITKAGSDYELLDSGDGEKLERFGEFVLSRPDPQALWQKRLSKQEWDKADAYFTRDSERADWSFRRKLPEQWQIEFGGLKFWIKPTAFKHTGLFPEQVVNWEWLRKVLAKAVSLGGSDETRPLGDSSSSARSSPTPPRGGLLSPAGSNDIEILNLFGYTGGATLACAQAGAKVVHIDGSKSAVAWARDNAELSDLKDKPVRWIVEDARTFVEREVRRGRQYDGIIMDPPAFGHGPSNELWKIEEHFLPLIESCKKLLKPKPLFFLINGYSAGYSAIAYENNLLPLKEKFGGEIEIGELAVEESKSQRLLPCGIFARWSAK